MKKMDFLNIGILAITVCLTGSCSSSDKKKDFVNPPDTVDKGPTDLPTALTCQMITDQDLVALIELARQAVLEGFSTNDILEQNNRCTIEE